MAAEKRLEIADFILSTRPHDRQALEDKLQALVDLYLYRTAAEMLKGEAASFVDAKWPFIIRRLLIESNGCFDLSAYILGLRDGAPKSAEFLPIADDRKDPEFAQFVLDAVVVQPVAADSDVLGMFASRCIHRGELIFVDHGAMSSDGDIVRVPAWAQAVPWELKVYEASFLELDTAGQLAMVIKGGIWPLLSVVEHSCDPNAAGFIIGNAFFLRSVHDIPAGEQIFMCHCDPGAPMAIRHLNIGFRCACARCQFETNCKLPRNLQRASKQLQWAQDILDPSRKAVVAATAEQVEAAAARMPNRQKMWLRTSFFAAGLYPLGLDEAIDTHLQSSSAGDAFMLRGLLLQDVEGKFRSKLLTAGQLCFPPCNLEALSALLQALLYVVPAQS